MKSNFLTFSYHILYFRFVTCASSQISSFVTIRNLIEFHIQICYVFPSNRYACPVRRTELYKGLCTRTTFPLSPRRKERKGKDFYPLICYLFFLAISACPRECNAIFHWGDPVRQFVRRGFVCMIIVFFKYQKNNLSPLYSPCARTIPNSYFFQR